MNANNLTLQEGYLAMFEFLVDLYQRTESDEIGAVLGDLSLLSDGTTADPAAWGDWVRCVEKARRGGIEASLNLTPPNV